MAATAIRPEPVSAALPPGRLGRWADTLLDRVAPVPGMQHEGLSAVLSAEEFAQVDVDALIAGEEAKSGDADVAEAP
ncbi:MAG: hypothetical protein ABI343_09345 [Burkholderiaceae bacterium]